MIKLLTLAVITLALFTTSALANHIIYVPGSTYQARTIITCETENQSLKMIRKITATRPSLSTKSTVRKIVEGNGCGFYEEPISFTVNSLICYEIMTDGKPFTLAKVTLPGTDDRPAYETFAVLFTFSNTQRCSFAT